ncbi:cysteine-rich receptor-like protein kinase 29 [Dorcoceras hygrometricum]|uniref:Cysteine-rich receptor-like protein kinase 29 n=1 Tax=Dorcoceras hygrometricum TaxID=472368 RepID=A0A2Z7B855_9LAMI|nr:cysteine-rich receptor-like protein kinase 29 [Dorcoceras hygrometricum]
MTVFPLNSGITDSACKNQLVVVSVQYDPFNPYIPIRSTIIGKSRVAKDPIAMHTSWRSNSDIASVTSIGYPRMSASGESSTTMHRLLHASGSHPIPPPNDPKTNQYNQYLGLIHSTNGNHLESPNEAGCSVKMIFEGSMSFKNEVNPDAKIRVRSLLSVLGFDLDVPLGLLCLLCVVSGFPGYSAGRGVGSAGGA